MAAARREGLHQHDVRAERPTDHPARPDNRRLATPPGTTPSAPGPEEGQEMPVSGHVIPSHPGADRVAVEVLLRDPRGERLWLIAWGFTVDDPLACAGSTPPAAFGSDYA